ncbi:MAG: hypothetical protein IPO16_15050 [Saprospiraceae bacterium]|nr:hypothetical protein [Saprospiraceae bacterium]
MKYRLSFSDLDNDTELLILRSFEDNTKVRINYFDANGIENAAHSDSVLIFESLMNAQRQIEAILNEVRKQIDSKNQDLKKD